MQEQNISRVAANNECCHSVPQWGLDHLVKDHPLNHSKISKRSPRRNYPGRWCLRARSLREAIGGLCGYSISACACLQNWGEIRSHQGQTPWGQACERICDHLFGCTLWMHWGMAWTTAGWNCHQQEGSGVPNHWCHFWWYLWICHCFRHDLGRLQLEAQLQMVIYWTVTPWC